MAGGLSGWALLAALSLLATVDALALAVRARTAGRAELALVAAASWTALIVTPVLVLGYANVLTPAALAAGSFVLLGVTFGALARARGVRSVLRDASGAARAIATLPVDAIREAARARSLVLLGLLVSAAILAEAVVLTVFIPNECWDGLMYHEPIVGFALQNHGFAMVHLPPDLSVQATNGYPRLCEAVSIWLVIFTDKTLIELPNDLAAPAMMLGAYVLARRFGDRLTAMGWACVLMLMPQAWTQLSQTYIDVAVAFFALFALVFATRPVLRPVDAALALLGTGLLLGSKGSALVLAPPIALLAAVRLVRAHGRARPALVAVTLAAGGVVLVVVGSVAPVRNWTVFGDPLWPASLDVKALGIHWGGLSSIGDMTASAPLREVIDTATSHPVGGMEDVIPRGYGYAIPWLVVPLGLVAIALGLGAWALERLRWRDRGPAWDLGPVLLLVIAGAMGTPTLSGQNARYNLHLVAGTMAAVTWLLSRRPWARLRAEVIAASIVLSILPLFWMGGPAWYWGSTVHLDDVLLHPLRSRTALLRPQLDLLAEQRNAELHAGDWVVFDQGVSFVGALWNFEMSNRVKYVKFTQTPEFLAAVDACSARWVAVTRDGGARKALERTARWELVGEIQHEGPVVFRRLDPDPK